MTRWLVYNILIFSTVWFSLFSSLFRGNKGTGLGPEALFVLYKTEEIVVT